MSVPTPNLDNIERVVNDIRDRVAAEDYAFDTAIGTFADDPTEGLTGCVAVVYQGKLFSLAISDAYLTLPPEELGLLISAVIFNAFEQWTQDLARLHEYADGVLTENARERGNEALIAAQS